ncbi:MAG: hypothetical protein P4L82_04735 [Ancalomicrobiaceae bacterium]|nr:hypothetical protein [Ancalomicrobiaceae bacterium]
MLSRILAVATVLAAVTGGTTAQAAERCGAGFWRGPHGVCHPYAHNRLCPRGYHIGPEGKRCWPN